MLPALLLALTLSQFSACARGSEPEIVGSERFDRQVRQALLLLKTRDANAYAIVTTYVGRIQQGERSGMWAYNTPPTYEMSDATAFYSVTWAAATIAHDSFHSKLYHDYRKAHGGSARRSGKSATRSGRPAGITRRMARRGTNTGSGKW